MGKRKRQTRSSSAKDESEATAFPLSELESTFIAKLITAFKKRQLEQDLNLNGIVFGPRLFDQLLSGLSLSVGSNSQQYDISNSKQQSYLIADIHHFLVYARLKRYESILNIFSPQEFEKRPRLMVTANFIINEYLQALRPFSTSILNFHNLIKEDIKAGSCFMSINFLINGTPKEIGGSETDLEWGLDQSLGSTTLSNEFVDSYQDWGDEIFSDVTLGNEVPHDPLDSYFHDCIDFTNLTSEPEVLFTTTDSKVYTLVEAKLCKNRGDEVKSGEKIFAMTLIGPGGVAIDYDVCSPADGFVSHYASLPLQTELKPDDLIGYVHSFNAFGPYLSAGLKSEVSDFVGSVLHNASKNDVEKVPRETKKGKLLLNEKKLALQLDDGERENINLIIKANLKNFLQSSSFKTKAGFAEARVDYFIKALQCSHSVLIERKRQAVSSYVKQRFSSNLDPCVISRSEAYAQIMEIDRVGQLRKLLGLFEEFLTSSQYRKKTQLASSLLLLVLPGSAEERAKWAANLFKARYPDFTNAKCEAMGGFFENYRLHGNTIKNKLNRKGATEFLTELVNTTVKDKDSIQGLRNFRDNVAEFFFTVSANSDASSKSKPLFADSKYSKRNSPAAVNELLDAPSL